ncbi:MAG: hydantoinase/oxoprolinase family protein [Pseudomonadota bacterium]
MRRPEPLARRADRLEVTERVGADGTVLSPLDADAVVAAAQTLGARGVGAIAVLFINAYANPSHEEMAARLVRQALPGVFVTTSSGVAAEYREFERFSTAAINAFVGPRAARYFDRLREGLEGLGLPRAPYTITSNGGLLDENSARAVPVRLALSGPAAGATGVGRILARHGVGDMVTFDVGGTSTDIAVMEGGTPRTVRARTVAGHPILSPMVDIEVIGAGGGSLARIDRGGALSVGPDSAGADPGPVAYAKGGTVPTLTDAALALGRLDPDAAFSGKVRLDGEAARDAIEKTIGAPLGLTVDEAAGGILAVASANMARTIRSAVIGRGAEPRRFSLVAYGGAGPLLAADVALALGMTRVIVPTSPGTLCARAILVSDIARDGAVTAFAPLDETGWAGLEDAFTALQDEGDAWLAGEGIPKEDRRHARYVDARYRGQNFSITVPVLEGASVATVKDAFHTLHEREQGFSLKDRVVDVVTVRVKASAAPPGAEAALADAPPAADSPARSRKVYFGGAWVETAILQREAIAPGTAFEGPAIINEATSTTVVPPAWTCRVLDDGTLHLTHDADAPT